MWVNPKEMIQTILKNDFVTIFDCEPRYDDSKLDMLTSGCVKEWNNIRTETDNNEIYMQYLEGSIENVNLYGINLSNTHFEGVTFKNVNLECANLTNAHFEYATFENVSFDSTIKIENCFFKGSNLEDFINKFNNLPICSDSQHQLLRQCCEKEDTSSWNQWKKDHPSEKIFLQNIHLNNVTLNKINLNFAHLEGVSLNSALLEKATLREAHLEGALLLESSFKGADLDSAHLKGANASGATFIRANLRAADLSGVDLWEANLENAILRYSNLEDVQISGDQKKPNLKNTDFTGALVNGKTIFLNCEIDENTNFTAVALGSARVEPSLLAALKNNIRRRSWKKSFKKNSKSCLGNITTTPMRLFWWLIDYGSSSSRIFISMLIAILFFTDLYLIASIKAPEGLGFYLNSSDMSELSCISVRYIGILCFAIATMVTLGFGNINANIVQGDPVITIVIFTIVTLNLVSGYLFLSLFVTRIGILYQSLAPAQKLRKKEDYNFYQYAYILFIFGIFYLIFPILISLNMISVIFINELLALALWYLLNLLLLFSNFFVKYFKYKIKLYIRYSSYKRHTKK